MNRKQKLGNVLIISSRKRMLSEFQSYLHSVLGEYLTFNTLLREQATDPSLFRGYQCVLFPTARAMETFPLTLAQKMRACGYDYTKLSVICNFIEQDKLDFFHSTEINEREKSRYYCYVGRLSEEKGVRMLLEVAVSLPFPLYIAGDGPLLNELQAKYSSGNVIFLGHLSSREIVRLVKHAQTMVVPSIWYENNPLSVIESLCMGTPVIGAEVGGIPELIREGDGMLFRMGDKEELASAIVSVMSKDNVDTQGIARRAQKRFSEERYWAELRNVYDL